ncbi:hypothetical protein TNCV_4695511 [Trichonephila clavipes]|nr:hypothetical protein TNCV_4695511 [Trichonephila clavipes]
MVWNPTWTDLNPENVSDNMIDGDTIYPSPSPQFRHGTGGERNTLQAPLPVVSTATSHKTFGTIELKSTYMRAFVDRPRNFEPWSSDVDDTSAGTPSPNYHTTPTG